MGNNKKSAGKNLIVQGSILAVAGIIVRLIGILCCALDRYPVPNTIDEYCRQRRHGVLWLCI